MVNQREVSPWVWAIMVQALLSRCVLLSDMEYKFDEQEAVSLIARADLAHWTPLGPVSGHAKIAHSSGFHYLLHCLAPYYEPLGIVATIAALNAVAIAVGVFLLRESKRYVYTFALCSTSLALILGSRKIWTPDLQAAWVCLSIGLLGLSISRTQLRAFPLAACSAFCLVMVGHMYLPGVYVAAVGCAAVCLAFITTRRWLHLVGWISGAVLGWSTFIPWAIAMLRRVPGTHAAAAPTRVYDLERWLSALRTGLTIHTPYDVYQLYLAPEREWIQRSQSCPWLGSTLVLIWAACCAGLVVFAFAIWTTVARWRAAFRDPLTLTAIALLLTMPLALYLAGLGTYLHYWLATIPFYYYWISWAVVRSARVWRWLVIGLCSSSLLAAVSFAGLVHKYDGLPGEYGQSYGSKRD